MLRVGEEPRRHGGYVPDRPRWRTLLVVAALHAGGVAVLFFAPHNSFRQLAQSRLAVFDVTLAPPPPPSRLADGPPPPPPPPPPPSFASAPTLQLPAEPRPIVAQKAPDVPLPPMAPRQQPQPQLPSRVDVAPSQPAPSAELPRDLTANMLSAPPPRYPIASRRAREQGTVVLDVRLDVDGRVEDIAIRRSSGSTRLDEAALSAVRRWRWSPTVVDDVAVRVRGLVEIPFVLH